MPNFDDDENKDPDMSPTRAKARVLLAAGVGIAAGASLAATQAGAASVHEGVSTLGVAAHKQHKAAHRPAPVPSPELLAEGDRGPAVKQLQRAVHRYPSGYFGSGTHRDVVHFQRRRHLTDDGVVGPQTRRALHLRVRIIQPPAPTPAAPVAATPATSTSASSTHAVAAPSTGGGGYSSTGGGGYSIPSGIVQCESGGNWHAVNPSSGAGGAYQIMPSTWQAYGGSGLPQDASPAEQSAIASKIWATSGPGAWSCG